MAIILSAKVENEIVPLGAVNDGFGQECNSQHGPGDDPSAIGPVSDVVGKEVSVASVCADEAKEGESSDHYAADQEGDGNDAVPELESKGLGEVPNENQHRQKR